MGAVAIVVPQHKAELTADEEISLRHLLRHLGAHDRYLVVPESLEAPLAGFRVERFPDRFFTSARAFATLQLRPAFYERFAAYEHMLMHQLDALVFSDGLGEFCAGDYDYIGAPWIGGSWPETVGNGGLSLRRVPAFLRVLESRRYRLGGPDLHWRSIGPRLPHRRRYRRGANSDAFWSVDAPRQHPWFRVAQVEEALRFSWELEPRVCLERTRGALPFGCHAWALNDRAFWEPYLDG